MEQRKTSLTPLGTVLTVLCVYALTASFVIRPFEFRFAASLLAAPLLMEAMLQYRILDKIQLSATAARTEAGKLFMQRVVIKNSSASRSLKEIVISEAGMHHYQGPGLVHELHSGQSLAVSLLARSTTRGHLEERSFVLETRHPFGFLSSKRRLSVRADLVTEPARVAMSERIVPPTGDGDTDWRSNELLGSSEFYSLREYRVGEDARTVHALRSAASGDLVRKVLRGQHAPDIGLVLDLRRPPRRKLSLGKLQFELAMRHCASLIDILHGHGLAIVCLVLGTEHSAVTRLTNKQEVLNFLTLLAEARAFPYQEEAPELLEDLKHCAACYWIPAGGYLATDEIHHCSARVLDPGPGRS